MGFDPALPVRVLRDFFTSPVSHPSIDVTESSRTKSAGKGKRLTKTVHNPLHTTLPRSYNGGTVALQSREDSSKEPW